MTVSSSDFERIGMLKFRSQVHGPRRHRITKATYVCRSWKPPLTLMSAYNPRFGQTYLTQGALRGPMPSNLNFWIRFPSYVSVI